MSLRSPYWGACCKLQIKRGNVLEIFGRPNTLEEATNGKGFSPVDGDEFVVGRSCDRVGIRRGKKDLKISQREREI